MGGLALNSTQTSYLVRSCRKHALPDKLRSIKADRESRTLAYCLEDSHVTVTSYPHLFSLITTVPMRVTGLEPATP